MQDVEQGPESGHVVVVNPVLLIGNANPECVIRIPVPDVLISGSLIHSGEQNQRAGPGR